MVTFAPRRLVALVFVLLAAGLVLAVPSAGSAQEAEAPSIWLPWEGGTVWRYMNGPHTGSGTVLDALDFQPPDAAGKQCETFTSAFWAVASADGRATVLPNAVEIDHGNGYRTGYYHLADKQVKTGDTVKAGQRLGRPGCCPDGGSNVDCWATEPHLHFYTASSGGRRPIIGTHIGGWLVDVDGCLVRPERRACRGALLISNAPRSGGATRGEAGITVALDVSGSTWGPASSGDVLRLAAPYLRAASEGENVTVLTFNSHARVLAAGPEKRPMEELAKALERSEPKGDTDLMAGLSLACREMAARDPAAKQALVLITDGFHNSGRLREPQRCFAERGWPVYVVAVGRPNAGLLGRITAATGGDYRPANSIFDPACEMERLRAALQGGVHAACNRFLLRAGERLSVPLSVPPEQAQAAFVLSSTPIGEAAEALAMDVTLRMPGRGIVTDEMALAHESDGRTERYAMASPTPGVWEAVVSGRGLPEAGVLVDLSFATTPTAFASGSAAGAEPTPEPAETADGETPDQTAGADATVTATPTPSPKATAKPTLPPRTTPTPTPSPQPTLPPR